MTSMKPPSAPTTPPPGGWAWVTTLLSLLALGVTNIQLGPALPAFVSPEVYEVLHTQLGLRPITTPEQDLVTV